MVRAGMKMLSVDSFGESKVAVVIASADGHGRPDG
jgi:hypothetical protein